MDFNHKIGTLSQDLVQQNNKLNNPQVTKL